MMGLSIALHLLRCGVRPLVIEKSFPGAGSTGKSGAILRQHYSTPLHVSMARHSLDIFVNYADYCGGSSGFVGTGMVLAIDSDDLTPFEQSLEMQRSLGVQTESLDWQGLTEVAPGAAFQKDSVGCFEPEAGFADPLLTLASLHNAVTRAGGRVESGVCVTGVDADSSVRSVRTNSGTIACDRLVVAAGAWSANLLRNLNIEIPIEPCRVQSGVFKRPAGFRGGPVLIDFPNRMYAKHTGDTHVGSLSPAERITVDPDDYDEVAESGYVKTARERLLKRFDVMGQSLTMGGYGALYAVTPDWHATVGNVGPDGLYLCAGFSGHGFKLAPAVGQTVAAELTGEEPMFDFEVLRPQRFEEGKLLKPGYAYSIMG